MPRPTLEHDGARRDEKGIGPGRVVALAGGDDEEDQDEEPGPREDAVGPPSLVPPEVADPGDPEVGRSDAEQHDLQREEAHALADGAVLVPDLTRQRELWPAVVGLPQEHRRPHRGSNGHAAPEPGTAQHLPRRRREGDADEETQQQDDGQLLVEEPQSCHDSHRQPLALVAAAQDAQHQPGDGDPDEEVHRRGDEEVAGQEDVRAQRHRDGGQDLREPSPAQVAGHQGSEHRDSCGGEGGREAEDDERPMAEAVHRPCEERRQGRLVGIAPREMTSGGQEIELVPVVAVPRAERDEHDGDAERDAQDRPPSDRRLVSSDGRIRLRVGSGHAPTLSRPPDTARLDFGQARVTLVRPG